MHLWKTRAQGFYIYIKYVDIDFFIYLFIYFNFSKHFNLREVCGKIGIALPLQPKDCSYLFFCRTWYQAIKLQVTRLIKKK